MEKKRAIVIGASSGIGRELAKTLAKNGYIVGLVGRNVERLEEVKSEISTESYTKRIDISEAEEAMRLLQELIKDMGGLELLVISSGIGFYNKRLVWEREKQTIDVDVTGFAAMANVAFNYFRDQGFGHVVGISSVAALRGQGITPAYAASKALGQNAFFVMSTVALFATANTVLILIIVTSRMIFGMSRKGYLPDSFSKISKRGTPWVAITVTMGTSILFVLLGNIATLYSEKLKYDPVTMKIVNHSEANKAIRREYRDGWSL